MIEHEDYEPEDDERINSTPTKVDKNFNFDMLREARPAINRIKPPDFDSLVPIPANPKTEPKLIDRAYYERANPAKSVVLPHRWQYYYCGCVLYDNPLPTIERLANPCTIIPIKTKEEIYVINIYTNKRLGITNSQRWRRECWDKLRPILEAAWILYRQEQTEQDSKQYFTLHSVINEDGAMVPEPPKKPGRPVSQDVLDLSDEDTTLRGKLIRRYNTYLARYRTAPTDALETNLNQIYATVHNLGGVPENWEQLMRNASATAQHKSKMFE